MDRVTNNSLAFYVNLILMNIWIAEGEKFWSLVWLILAVISGICFVMNERAERRDRLEKMQRNEDPGW